MGTPREERPRVAASFSLVRSRGTLAELFSGRNNGIGFVRLMLATAVVLSHSKPLGFDEADLGHFFFGKQTNVGNLAVYGFFVLSGVLITRSARRASIFRYTWHRALRILPGLWVCLLVSALVVGPLIAIREHGDLNGYWSGPKGPWQYLAGDWWTGVREYGIHDLFVQTTPWGRHTGTSVFNGAIWSLSYEMLCYVVIGILAVTGVLRQARRFVLLTTVGVFAIIVKDYWEAGQRIGPVTASHPVVNLPLIGDVHFRWMIYLGFLFLLGALFDLYAEKIPVHDGLGILSLLVFAGTLHYGAFYVLGFPAYAYLLMWAGVRAPKQLHWVGRKNDYSYGIYIYGFVGQQVLVSLGYARWGFVPFVAMSMVVAYVAGYISWHLVEKHAMSLKGWTPRLPDRFRRKTSGEPSQPVESPSAEALPVESRPVESRPDEGLPPGAQTVGAQTQSPETGSPVTSLAG